MTVPEVLQVLNFVTAKYLEPTGTSLTVLDDWVHGTVCWRFNVQAGERYSFVHAVDKTEIASYVDPAGAYRYPLDALCDRIESFFALKYGAKKTPD